jgi:chromate transporter
VWLFVAAGAASLLAREGPRFMGRAGAWMVPAPWLVTGLHGPSGDQLWTVFRYFAEAGALVFGSGLAIVPFLHAGVVGEFQWLSERQFLDAVAVAMITPGPVVITVAFIGYLVAGPLGAGVAALGVFLPAYLLVIVPAAYFRRSIADPRVKSFVDGVTAAAAGAIAGAAFVLGKRAIVDLPTAVIGLATVLVVIYVKKAPEPLVILAAGLVGLAIQGLVP